MLTRTEVRGEQSLERGVCPEPNLVRRQAFGDSHRRFRLDRAPFRFTETE